jgi:hypothetical protein
LGSETSETVDALEDEKWRSLILLQEEVASERIYVVEAEATTNRSLSILKRIPSEAYPGFKVV